MVIGFSGIIFLKLPGILLEQDKNNELVLLAPAIWAILILFSYATLVRFASSSQIEPETTGDNCYYLGFLFTLVSLAVTFYYLRKGQDEFGILLPNIISGFGVALSSTIVGIGLRVWFFQQRTEIVARDKENQIEVQRAIREFRKSLSESTSRLKQFSTETIQLTTERDKKIRESTEEILEHQSTRVTIITKELEKLLEHQSSTLQRNSETFNQAIKETMIKIIGNVAEDFQKSLVNGFQVAFTELGNSVHKLADNFDNLRQVNIRTLSELQEKSSQLSKVFDETCQKQLDSTTSSLENFQNIIENTVQAHQREVENLLKSYEGNAQKLEQIVTQALTNGFTLASGNITNAIIGNSKNAFIELEFSTNQLKKSLDEINQEEGAILAFSNLKDSVNQINQVIDEIKNNKLDVISELPKSTSEVIKKIDKSWEMYLDTATSKSENFLKQIENTILAHNQEVINQFKNFEKNTDKLSISLTHGITKASETISKSQSAFNDLEQSAIRLSQTLNKINQDGQAMNPNPSKSIFDRIFKG